MAIYSNMSQKGNNVKTNEEDLTTEQEEDLAREMEEMVKQVCTAMYFVHN